MIPGRVRLAVAVVAIVVAVAAAFWPMAGNGFVDLDDWLYVTRNEMLHRPLDAATLGLMFTPGYASNWHPLTWLSHWIDVRLFGLEPRGHHLHNLLLHLAASLLLLVVLVRMTGRLWPPLALVLIFAVHPLRVESVAWAAERKDVLAILLGVGTLASYLAYLRRPGPWGLVLPAAVFSLGIMAKPTLVVLPAILLILDWWPLGRLAGSKHLGLGRALAEKSPLVALALLSSVLTLVAQRRGVAIGSLATYPAGRRLANAVESIAAYLGKTAWPTDLAAFYPYPATPPGPLRLGLAIALVAAISTATLLLRRRAPFLLAGWAWFVTALLPLLGLVQAGNQARADRYTYLPSIGLGLMIAWSPSLLPRSARRWVWLLPAVAVTLTALVATTRGQVLHWRDDVALYRRMLDVSPGDPVIANSLGVALGKAGRPAEAEPLFRLAVDRQPGSPDGWSNLANALDLSGRREDASAVLRQAVERFPDSPDLRGKLAILGGDQRRPAGNRAHLSFPAKVVHVDDGDTIQVISDRRRITIRLHGIDAPERGQPFGNRARKFTGALCSGVTVTVSEFDTDQYGRTVAEVLLPDGRSLNREVVRAGYAWWYRRYTDNPVLARLEGEARQARAGLWADPKPEPPWEFRRRTRPETAPKDRSPAVR